MSQNLWGLRTFYELLKRSYLIKCVPLNHYWPTITDQIIKYEWTQYFFTAPYKFDNHYFGKLKQIPIPRFGILCISKCDYSNNVIGWILLILLAVKSAINVSVLLILDIILEYVCLWVISNVGRIENSSYAFELEICFYKSFQVYLLLCQRIFILDLRYALWDDGNTL